MRRAECHYFSGQYDLAVADYRTAAVSMRLSFDEFVRAVRLAPHLFAPLVVRTSEESRLVLTDRARASVPSMEIAAVRDDVHSKPTVVRMAAVRPEELPNGGRRDEE